MEKRNHFLIFPLILLPLLCVATFACTHSSGKETTVHRSVQISKKTKFTDYLPDSAVKEKFTCSLEPGKYALFAPPLPLQGSDWVFVNFKEKPKSCDFWQGFVNAHAINPTITYSELSQQSDADLAEPKIELSASGAGSKNATGVAMRLLATYGTESGYDKIEREVLGWYGEKREGCVAFASTALRSIGEPVPLAALKGDDAVSIVTKPFVEYLIETLKYEKINDLESAQPGDIGVTVDDKLAPGYPTHVYVFANWESKTDKMARVIDNQGYRHLRPLNRSTEPRFADKDPTVYFLRPTRSTR